MKQCYVCKSFKIDDKFLKSKKSKNGYANICRLCRKEYMREYEKSDERKLKKKEDNDNRATRRKELRWKRIYGLEFGGYSEMLKKQDSRCCICKKHHTKLKISLAVDHNHRNGEIRGLLCNNCNVAIGFLPSIKMLSNAIKYLKEKGE